MKVAGKVSVIIYHNETNGYTILTIKTDKEYMTAVGETFEIDVGDEIELEGYLTKHKIYGTQFKFSTCSKTMPKDELTLITYISDNVKGIGKKTAQNIVRQFGEETVEVIKNKRERLAEVSGLNEEKIDNLTTFFKQEWEKWNAIDFLSSYGISVLLANKIYEALKSDTIDMVKQDPYSLLDFVKTLSFKDIDEIGINQGIEPDNPSRMMAGILYTLNQITEFGHTCVPLPMLIKHASESLKVESDMVENTITTLKLKNKLAVDSIDGTEYAFLYPYYISESNISNFVINSLKMKCGSKQYEKEIEKVSEKNSIVLSNEQHEAIVTSLNHPFTVITGGPGTGKTTIIKCIIDILELSNKSYVLTAPTGRAAKRITETTKKEAKTLHRLLEILKIDDKDLEAFVHYNVKPVEKDVVIVDEASMIDTMMMNNLVRSLSPTTKLILVGDVNQLPSVGPGCVLKDLIDTEKIPYTSLKEIYRQSKQSDIVVSAHLINHGEYPVFKNTNTDLFFIPTCSIEDTLTELKSLITHRLENYADMNILTDLQILTPTKKTELGTWELNKTVQTLLNTAKEYGKFKGFKPGDKVMQIINNYDREYDENGVRGTGIYNGDIGYITKIDEQADSITVVYDDTKLVEYKREDLEELELSYVITIHKSQGSEYPYVIIPLYNGYPKLFTRNLLYTAMTRAKKMLIIIGSKDAIHFMVDNTEEKKRLTGLKHKILTELN